MGPNPARPGGLRALRRARLLHRSDRSGLSSPGSLAESPGSCRISCGSTPSWAISRPASPAPTMPLTSSNMHRATWPSLLIVSTGAFVSSPCPCASWLPLLEQDPVRSQCSDWLNNRTDQESEWNLVCGEFNLKKMLLWRQREAAGPAPPGGTGRKKREKVRHGRLSCALFPGAIAENPL